MASSTSKASTHPDGIFSLLDTDLYKLTMQCAVLKFFPKVEVAYTFTNRTPHMKLTRTAFNWLQIQVDKLANVTVTREEVEWLKTTCPFFSHEYLDYLQGFHLKPTEHLKLLFTPTSDSSDDSTPGDVSIETRGLWVETILYEIPLLALVSEAYFKFVDRDWTHDGQTEKAEQKGLELLETGCVFSEFGSRRRRDYKTHEMVMQGLVDAQKEAADHPNWKGKFTGTSNVHFAMRFRVAPVGTVAHEWFMGIAAIEDDYAGANEKAMQYWTAAFGRGVLAIALTDTFGTPSFLKAFAKTAPKSDTLDSNDSKGNDPTYAQIFTGVRQDSGDPLEFIKRIKAFYASQDITDPKIIVFSDSLNVEKAVQYREATLAAGLTPSFGIGTFLTNDFQHESKPQKKSVPLNIVIKLSEAQGRKAVKLSDNKGKNMGDDELVRKVKDLVGYEERDWKEGDEGFRWDI